MPKPPAAGSFLKEGDTVSFGNSEMKVIHVPGHSPGSVAFYSEKDQFLIVGDILFNGSIGRTDLPMGNHEQLISGIKSKLLKLDDEVVVYSGHGPETTIGNEKWSNPYLQ
jgi:hydroxyacylglutathione hydrolase